MQILELTLPAAAENLALDEALLETAEASQAPRDTLRLWEAAEPLVVIGRSSQVAVEVDTEFCQQHQIPVLRRTSGGASIVAGPGCLMYAVVLSYELHPELRSIDRAHDFVLDHLAAALGELVPGVTRRGTSDLAISEQKFSGNSLRCKQRGLLYHGTLLYDFRLELVEQCLRMPPRMPEYRGQRAHARFIRNLPVARDQLVTAVARAFGGDAPIADWPRDLTRQFAQEKYSQPSWNLQR